LEPVPRLLHELAQRHVLAIGPERHQHGKLPGSVRPIDIGAQPRAVTHRDLGIAVQDHGGPRAGTRRQLWEVAVTMSRMTGGRRILGRSTAAMRMPWP